MTTERAECEAVAGLVATAAKLYRQWRHGLWESVAEMRAVRTDLPAGVFRLVDELIEADLAATAAMIEERR
jgi:hypothetical protein